MAMFTLPQMIQRLTRGFVKVTGRMPDGLEKIKIKQEALEKIKHKLNLYAKENIYKK